MKQKKTYVILEEAGEALFTTDSKALANEWRLSDRLVEVVELPTEGIQERFRQGLKCWWVTYYYDDDEPDVWVAGWDELKDRDGVWEGGDDAYFVWAKTEAAAIKAVEKYRKEKGRKKLEMMRAIAKERKGK